MEKYFLEISLATGKRDCYNAIRYIADGMPFWYVIRFDKIILLYTSKVLYAKYIFDKLQQENML